MRKLTIIIVLWGVAGSVPAAGSDGQSRVNNEAEIRTTVELRPVNVSTACQAELAIEYYQKAALAHVETTLTNSDCGASSGSYRLEVRYRDADGNPQVRNFEETWQRSDAKPVRQTKEYRVAEGMELIRVRSRRLRCSCESVSEETD